MRSHPGLFDLSFLMPRGARRSRFDDLSRHPCVVEVDGPLVRIRGDSREQVFECAADLVRSLQVAEPVSIAAILHTPSKPSGFDRWSIIAGADVAFSPTGLGATFPTVQEPPCPAPAANEKTVTAIRAVS